MNLTGAFKNFVVISVFLAAAVLSVTGQQNAADLFKEGKFAAADKALGAKPAIFEEIRLKGQIALFSNRLKDALRFLQMAAKLNPEDKSVRTSIGQTYYRLNDFKNAAKFYRAAGREPIAKKLESLAGKEPYKISGKPDETTVPFVKLDPLPVVTASVNGRELTFLIDTGGPELIIDTAVAGELGLQLFGEESGTFAAGQRSGINHAVAGSVGIGQFRIGNVPVNVLPTQRYASVLGVPRIDGILGTVLLSRFLTTLDYPGSKLVLRKWSRAQHSAEKDVLEVPFWMSGDHYIVAWGSFNGSPQFIFVDTGLAGMGFAAPDSTIKNAGITIGGRPFEGSGGGGTVKAQPFVADSLSLGPVKAEKIVGVAGVFPPSLENSMGFRIGGLLSHTFFKPYAVTFDFERMKMIFRRSSK